MLDRKLKYGQYNSDVSDTLLATSLPHAPPGDANVIMGPAHSALALARTHKLATS